MSAFSPHLSVQDDPIPLNDALRDIVSEGLDQAREAAHGSRNVERVTTLLQNLANTDIPLSALCTVRANLEPFLQPDELEAVGPAREQTIHRIGAHLSRERDPRQPLLPDRVIVHPLTRFPNSPWYVATFVLRDPHFGITAGPHDPHYVLIRATKPLPGEGQDLPSDFFVNSGYFTDDDPLVRIHSECLLGDTAASQARCDCGEQFGNAVQLMESEASERGRPALFWYLRQEGRGIGLKRKIHSLQRADGRQGPEGKWVGSLDTSAAMLAEGHADSEFRDFGYVARMAHGLGLSKIGLLTNNERKLAAFNDNGIHAEAVTLDSEARTLENLGEFLWKLLTGYKITSKHLGSLFIDQIQALRTGQRIDNNIYNFLYMLKLVRKLEPDAYIPPEVEEALTGLELRAPRGVEQLSARILRERSERLAR